MTTTLNPVLFAKAIADETRQKIMKLTCCRWRTVNDIVEQLNVTQPTVSHHLAILREAGLVNFKEDGKADLLPAQPQSAFCMLRPDRYQVFKR